MNKTRKIEKNVGKYGIIILSECAEKLLTNSTSHV